MQRPITKLLYRIKRFFIRPSVETSVKPDLIIRVVNYSLPSDHAGLSEEDVFHAGLSFSELEALVSVQSEQEYKDFVDKVTVLAQLEADSMVDTNSVKKINYENEK